MYSGELVAGSGERPPLTRMLPVVLDEDGVLRLLLVSRPVVGSSSVIMASLTVLVALSS